MKIDPILVVIVFGLFSCQEVIYVDLPEEEPRLIVDAIVPIDRAQSSLYAQVIVKESSSFFDEAYPVELKQISFHNLTTNFFEILIETTPGTGVYEKQIGTNFFVEGEVILQIDYGDQLFYATTRFVPSIPIDTVVHELVTLDGKEKSKVSITFTDQAGRDDFYIVDFGNGTYETFDGRLFDGKTQVVSYVFGERFESGEVLLIRLMGADRSFYNYMSLILEQSLEDVSPFDTPGTTVRGNVFNVTDIDNIDYFDNVHLTGNFPLGYYAIVETSFDVLTVR